MDIQVCTLGDLDDWATLRRALWPDEDRLRAGAEAMLAEDDKLAMLCRSDTGEALGFAEASIRRDYVNGCDTSPVAFLEGIYVAPGHRQRGIARALAERVAIWARGFGCAEFASDALIENEASHAFHAAIGFAETERVVYFRRAL
ncbi:GNAT family N-acetyltransferase [Sphingomonas sp. JC676]|uniref:aminoglycoside 6'-N-acetyltransferase n=1 Tax=Sphingomonas sp. JC676 TaxID=2768065 RepID=UPI001658082A|nr:aminoglycoside 6'-N-acetyltransferase [Sphingomonas sp. JC676]MBC9031774.1 GNAT family N-acetyltransferase [Sphingomonas sp. JC676]